ncbi:MAG: hypothetical protein RIB45_02735 [Marivibrio sp.]|uniref:hypothetical protein n=1 Tax=Marivibrio sp. TaxID=2039719 RepID=UPI0032F061A9
MNELEAGRLTPIEDPFERQLKAPYEIYKVQEPGLRITMLLSDEGLLVLNVLVDDKSPPPTNGGASVMGWESVGVRAVS